MTYQEIKDRLSKCELTLEKIKNGTYKNTKKINVEETTKQLTILRESLQKQLLEADKGVVATDDESKAKELADDGVNVKLTSEMKPGSEEAAEHERMKNLSPKDQERIKQIHALMQRERDAIEKDARKAKGMMEGDLDVGHQDDEPGMLKNKLFRAAKMAAMLYKKVDKYDKMGGEVDFPSWWQNKINKSQDMLQSAYDYLDGEENVAKLDAMAEKKVEVDDETEFKLNLRHLLDKHAQ